MSCSTRDTPPCDICIMTLPIQHIYVIGVCSVHFSRILIEIFVDRLGFSQTGILIKVLVLSWKRRWWRLICTLSKSHFAVSPPKSPPVKPRAPPQSYRAFPPLFSLSPRLVSVGTPQPWLFRVRPNCGTKLLNFVFKTAVLNWNCEVIHLYLQLIYLLVSSE